MSRGHARSHVGWLLLVLVAALIVSIVTWAVSCSGGCTTEQAIDPDAPYESPYDFSCLTQADGRFTYTVDGQVKSRTGIDISQHEGGVDWEAVAADGIEFAFVRLGNRGTSDGNLYTDDNYEQNLNGARDAGLDVGVYLFSAAIDEQEAREEAEYVIDVLGGTRLSYPVVYDFEPTEDGTGRADDISDEQLSKNAAAFCQRIAQAGYTPMIYCNKREGAKLDLRDSLRSYQVWYAQYEVSEPEGQFDFVFWQYSIDGEVDGIDAAVDMDILLDEDMLK